jgi:AcrR family transcriptional regulator
MPRTKLRTPALRQEVLRAAVATIADGPSAFTTRRVASAAGTSAAAIYELFNDRSDLLRSVFFEGFRLLGERVEAPWDADDPVGDLRHLFFSFRSFVRDNPGMAELMFSTPFPDFRPGPEEADAGAATRWAIVERVGRCVDAGSLVGDPIDAAHVFLGMAQGLALQETAGWLGTTPASTERRWNLAFDLVVRQR